MKVYTVMHYLGIDGTYPVTTFSKKPDANKLCEMYKKTTDFYEYDCYYLQEIEIDKYSINDFVLEDEDGDKILVLTEKGAG